MYGMMLWGFMFKYGLDFEFFFEYVYNIDLGVVEKDCEFNVLLIDLFG